MFKNISTIGQRILNARLLPSSILPEKKVSDRDIVVFTRLLTTMIIAGIPIVQALYILSKQSENKSFRKTISSMKNDIQGGYSLSEALQRHPKIFNKLYVNIVELGETGGIVDDVLLNLSNYLEKAINLKSKLIKALIYPCIVILTSLTAIAVIMV